MVPHVSRVRTPTEHSSTRRSFQPPILIHRGEVQALPLARTRLRDLPSPINGRGRPGLTKHRLRWSH
jgi:hypothetical protein